MAVQITLYISESDNKELYRLLDKLGDFNTVQRLASYPQDSDHTYYLMGLLGQLRDAVGSASSK